MTVSVNGEAAGSGKPGTYLAIDRQWHDGDAIEFTLPAEIRVKPYYGKDQIPGKSRYSIEYGPVLLAATGSSKVDVKVARGRRPEEIAAELQPIAGHPLEFAISGSPQYKLIPYWQVLSEEEFTCYPTITVQA